MAIFNPQLPPSQDPNYLSYSKVVEAPSPDTSKGQTLQGIGEGIKDTFALSDIAIKKGIDSEAYSQVDKERDKYTAGLEQIKQDLDNGKIKQPSSPLDANAQATDEDIPDGLASGLSRIDSLAQAKRAGSLKLNDTQYSGNVLAIAKQLRNQYGTGYREYIDQKVSQASGLPVANSYYQNMLVDINRQLNQVKTQKDDIEGIMKHSLQEGNVAMAGFMLKYRQDPSSLDTAAVLNSAANHAAAKAQLAVDAAARSQSTFDKETQVQTETKNVTRNINNLVTNGIEDSIALDGMPSVRNLISYMDDYSAGRLKGADADAATVQQRNEQLLVYENYYRRQAQKLAGPAAELGIDTKKIIDTALTPITTYTTLARDKMLGPASFHNRQIQAVKDDEVHNNWLFDKDRAALSRRLLGAREVLGDQYFPDYIKSIMIEGQDKPIKDLFSQEALSAIMPVEDQRGNTNPRYMTDAIKHAKQKGDIPFDYYGSIVGWTEKLTDPFMPLQSKDRLVDWAFNPKNIGILKEFKMDYRDPNTGDWVPGKYRAFNIMTSTAITQNIVEASKLKPENYVKYKSWAESEFGTLYRGDLQDLNKVIAKPYLGVHFGYNPDSKEFSLVDTNNRPIDRDKIERLATSGGGSEAQSNAAGVKSAAETLDRVNSALGRLGVIYKSDPSGEKDVDQYMLKLMQTAGFRPGSNLTNATEGMAKALIMSRNPEMTPQQLNERFLKITKPVHVQGLE